MSAGQHPPGVHAVLAESSSGGTRTARGGTGTGSSQPAYPAAGSAVLPPAGSGVGTASGAELRRRMATGSLGAPAQAPQLEAGEMRPGPEYFAARPFRALDLRTFRFRISCKAQFSHPVALPLHRTVYKSPRAFVVSCNGCDCVLPSYFPLGGANAFRVLGSGQG